MQLPLTRTSTGIEWDKGTFVRMLHALPFGRYVLRVTRETRSTAANAYLWGVVYALIAEETGLTPDEVHESLKIKFRSRECLSTGLTIVRSTRTGSDDFWQYVEQVREWSAGFLGVYIPAPNEPADEWRAA